MLHDFLTAHREELIARCVAKVAKRPVPAPSPTELTHGIPLFLSQITETLRREEVADDPGSRRISGSTDPAKTPTTTEIGEAAAQHGGELQHKGFTVDQVVHDYGDLCQAITELAVDRNVPISAVEFRTLNRCLDNAIADAVTRFASEQERSINDRAADTANQRLGALAHELRGKLNVVGLAVEAIKRGAVGIAGATGGMIDRGLTAMRDMIDRSFAEVRLRAGLPPPRECIPVSEVIEDVQIFAGVEAQAKGLALAVQPGEPGLAVNADRHVLASAVSNILQNAIKFTPPGGRVAVNVEKSADRVLIAVADQCGGLPVGDPKELFQAFAQRSTDRTGLGLGLSISRRGIEAHGGRLHVQDRPGEGCVFTIDLPLTSL